MGPACCSQTKQQLQNPEAYTLKVNKDVYGPEELVNNKRQSHVFNINSEPKTPPCRKRVETHQINLSPEQTSVTSQGSKRYGNQIVLTPQRPSLRKLIEQSLKYSSGYELTWLKVDCDQKNPEAIKQFLGKSTAKWEDFVVYSYLGKGTLGQVFLGQYKQEASNDNAPYYAIKRVQFANVNWKKVRENFKVQSQLKEHSKRRQFIAKQYHLLTEKDNLCLVLEFAPGGSIASFTKKGSSRNQFLRQNADDVIRFILGCVVLGLEFLHSRDIVYQDLKPNNLLVFDDGYIKMADFGVSKKMREGSYYLKPGMLCYFAPQMVFGFECLREVDLWSLGVLAYELACGAYPFSCDQLQSSAKYLDKVAELQNRRNWPTEVNLELKDLISSLLRLEPEQRLGAGGWHQVKNHTYFRGNNFSWQSLQSKDYQSPLLKGVYSDIVQRKAEFSKIKMDRKGSLYTIEEMFSNPMEQCSPYHLRQ